MFRRDQIVEGVERTILPESISLLPALLVSLALVRLSFRPRSKIEDRLTSIEKRDLARIGFPEVFSLVEGILGRAPLINVGIVGIRHNCEKPRERSFRAVYQ